MDLSGGKSSPNLMEVPGSRAASADSDADCPSAADAVDTKTEGQQGKSGSNRELDSDTEKRRNDANPHPAAAMGTPASIEARKRFKERKESMDEKLPGLGGENVQGVSHNDRELDIQATKRFYERMRWGGEGTATSDEEIGAGTEDDWHENQVSTRPGAVAIAGWASRGEGTAGSDEEIGAGTEDDRHEAQVSTVRPGAVAVAGWASDGAATPDDDSAPVGGGGGSLAESTTDIAIPTAEVVDDDELQLEREENRRLATEIEQLRGQMAQQRQESEPLGVTGMAVVVAQRWKSNIHHASIQLGLHVGANDEARGDPPEDRLLPWKFWKKLRACTSDWRIVVAVPVVVAAVIIGALAATGQFNSSNDGSSNAGNMAQPSDQVPASKRESTLYSVRCETTADCEEKLQAGSVCLERTLSGDKEINDEREVQKYCTNPFASGCLRQMEVLKKKDREDGNLFPKRVCNSEDEDVSGDGSCTPTSSTMEVRIAPADWESSVFLSWIFQILLSETLNVPVTFETGKEGGALSFYDPDPNAFALPSVQHNWDALSEAYKVKDCTITSKECAHFMPEVWNGRESKWMEHKALGEIEHLHSGVDGELSWYVPKFVAEKDPSLVSFEGISGEHNRKKLADTFKRPTTWLDYCLEVSTTNCTGNDTVATRWPSKDEEGMYFMQYVYTGHFRATDENNCDKNPSTCTGHIVDAKCEWSTFTEAQLYWNEIALQSDGPLAPNKGYTYSAMIEIWSASNATGSPVIMWWWRPDKLVQIFRGGPNEFHPVPLPESTFRCTRSRVSIEERCSENIKDRRGVEDGSCGYDVQKTQKIISKSLEEGTSAYDAFRFVQVTTAELEEIIEAWVLRGGTGGYKAREAVCSWVDDNIDLLQKFIPTWYT